MNELVSRNSILKLVLILKCILYGNNGRPPSGVTREGRRGSLQNAPGPQKRGPRMASNGMTSRSDAFLIDKIEVVVNETAFINCTVNASIDIQWHFNSLFELVFAGGKLRSPYNERLRTEDDKAGSHILIIPEVRSEDAGVYYCQEEISGRQISSTHLTVLQSSPVCGSNMKPHGFVGPSTCNLEQEYMIFTCAVSFNGEPPQMIWTTLNYNQSFNESTCKIENSRINCSLVLRADSKYDGSIFNCHPTKSSANCNTEIIKIQYFEIGFLHMEKNINEEVNCSVKSNQVLQFKWNQLQGNQYETLVTNQTLLITSPGFYRCIVEYRIRNTTCTAFGSEVNVPKTHTCPNETGQAGTAAITVLSIIVVICIAAIIAVLYLFRRKALKHGKKIDEHRLEMSLLTDVLDSENNIPNTMIQENNKIKYQVISMYKDFVSEVDPMNIFDHLKKNGIVSSEEKQKIMTRDTAKERCRALVDHLFCCSKENAFIILREALEEHYPRITERLETIGSDDENEDDYSTSKMENEKIRNKIYGMYDDFVLDVDPVNVFDLLIQSKILNIKQKQFIMKKSAKREERCRALLDHLMFCSKENAFIIFKEALKEHYPRIVGRIDTFDADNEIEFSTRIESSIIVVGLDNNEEIYQDVLKINLNGTNDVSTMRHLPPQMVRESTAAVYGNTLFVTGVSGNSAKIWKFDVRSSKWEFCNTMIRGRRKHSVAFVDHILYICGGWVDAGEITLDDVEAYDTIDDRCTTVGKLVHAVDSAGNCVSFKSSLYIFGGDEANDETVDYVQVYDTKINSCTLLSQRMPVAHRLFRAVLWGNKAILLGNYICFIYNFDTRIWQMRDQFKTDVYHFGLIVHDDKLFVIGGSDWKKVGDGNDQWICRDDVRSVPVENVLNNESIEWSHHAKLPRPSFVHSFGKMEFRVQ